MDHRLIYDIGLHLGEDTSYYLRKGYKVIAIDANPMLARKGAERFSKAVASGQLKILNVGISDQDGIMPFYVNKSNSELSSFDKDSAMRFNSSVEVIDVRCVHLSELFREHGVPYYLKVDIERFDHYALRAIPDSGDKPVFVSCEAAEIEWLDILRDKGYNRFKMINQVKMFMPLNAKLENNKWLRKAGFLYSKACKKWGGSIFFPHEYSSSGPFGNGTRGSWKTYDEVRNQYQQFFGEHGDTPMNNFSWFDFHATTK